MSVGAIASSAPVDIYPGENKTELFWNATLYTFQRYGTSLEHNGDSIRRRSVHDGGDARGDKHDDSVGVGGGGGGVSGSGGNIRARDHARGDGVVGDRVLKGRGSRSTNADGEANANAAPTCDVWIAAAVERMGASDVDRTLLTTLFDTCSPVKTDGDVARLLLYVQV
jgi:hypothetical protein